MHVCDAALGVVCGYLEDLELSRFSRCSQRLQTSVRRVSVLSNLYYLEYKDMPMHYPLACWNVGNVAVYPWQFGRIPKTVRNITVFNTNASINSLLDTDNFNSLDTLRIIGTSNSLVKYKNSKNCTLCNLYISMFSSTFDSVFYSVENLECDYNCNLNLKSLLPNLKRLTMNHTIMNHAMQWPATLDYADIKIEYNIDIWYFNKLNVPDATVLNIRYSGPTPPVSAKFDISGHCRVREITIPVILFKKLKYNKQLQILHVLDMHTLVKIPNAVSTYRKGYGVTYKFKQV